MTAIAFNSVAMPTEQLQVINMIHTTDRRDMAMKSSPPASRLLGKSPAYVRIYTETYRSEIVKKRLIGTSIGTAGCVGAMLIILNVARVDD